MKIDISKPHREKTAIDYKYETPDAKVGFIGTYKKEGQFLVLSGVLTGSVKVVCDVTGEDFYDSIDEDIKIKFTSEIYNGFDEKFDIIELDSEMLDFDSFLQDEIESFKLGFHRKESSESQF